MKHWIRFNIITFVSLLAFLPSHAQQTIILDGFVGVAQAKQVQLRWIISAGETCNGTIIERSTDTVHWEFIGDIPGVCGSSSAAVPYNYIDESPAINTINFYRLELGGQGYSAVIGVPFYDYSEKGFVLIPNPASESATIYFSTSATETFTISLYSISGNLVKQSTGSGGSCRLNVSRLAAGTYLFVISRQGKKNVSGKIIVH